MFSLLQAQFHPTSPVLVNSGFSQYDYFSTAPILTASPQSSVSAYSSSPRLHSLSTGLTPCTPQRQREQSPSRDSDDNVDPMGFTLLPKVLTSPQSANKKDATATAAAKRRLSVQVHFNELASVNWARPLKVEHEHDGEGGANNWASNSMKIFGASLQRSRRLNRNPIPFPSPASSSDEGPTTPSPVLSQPLPPRISDGPDHASGSGSESESDLPLHCWSVENHGKGLGVSGVVEWDTPLSQDFGGLELESPSTIGYLYEPLTLNLGSSSTLNLDLGPSTESASTTTLTSPIEIPNHSAPTPSPARSGPTVQVQITPPNPRILATSQSLNSFSSPSTLLELQNLRRAASELEIEARKPIKVGIPQERKIKRKAVPSIVETVPTTGLVASPSSSTSTSRSNIEPGPGPRPSIPGRHSSLSSLDIKRDQERELINIHQEQEQEKQEMELTSPIEMNRIERLSVNDDIFTRHGQFYQNHLSTQSAIDISGLPKVNNKFSGSRSGLGYSGSMRINTGTNTNTKSKPDNKRPESIIDFQSTTSTSTSTSTSSSSSSSYLSLSEIEPTTPTSLLSASQTEYFLSSVEKAFQILESERKEIQQRTTSLNQGTGTSTPPGTSTGTATGWTNSLSLKHRRGFPKFLGNKI